MYRKLAVTAALLCVGAIGRAQPITLEQAMRLAQEASPAVRGREAQIAAAQGNYREAAALLFNNPSLTTEGTRRNATIDGRSAQWNEWTVGVAQPFETGGQQRNRRLAANSTLEALDAEVLEAKLQARAEAATRFVAVMTAQRRIAIEQRASESFERTARTIARRKEVGEDTRLDANVAMVEAERSRNALASAREQWLEARAELANALLSPPGTLPEIVDDGDSNGSDVPVYTLEQVLTGARSLPRQRALSARLDAARARLDVERGNRYPDVTVGVSVGREGPSDARERLATLSVSVPLPLFKNNEAAIGLALSEQTQVEVDLANAGRDAEAKARRLFLRAQSVRERVQRLRSATLPLAADNTQLAAKSRQAGQIGALEQLVVDRQALDAERELNDALSELRLTTVELEHAAGILQGKIVR